MFKCLACSDKFVSLEALYDHYIEEHEDAIPKDYTAAQYHYLLKTNRSHGNCVICKRPTAWNEATDKYHRFCGDPACKAKYVEQFKSRMIGVHGKVHLLNDPTQQRKMLANRAISGEYDWSDGKKIPYTGTYEKDFLQFLDVFMNYDSADIMAPSPHTYYYTYEGVERFYIPDFFIPSLNLEIEVKDGGDNPNNHHKIQHVDKEKERLKDRVMTSQKEFSYVKIINKKYEAFFDFLIEKKKEFASTNVTDKPVFILENTTEVVKTKDSQMIYENNNEAIKPVVEQTVNIVPVKESSPVQTDTNKYPVFVILTHSGTTLSNIIKKVTKNPYSHASISFSPDLDSMYSFGRKYKDNPFIGTFVKEDINAGLFNDVKDTATYSMYVTWVSADEKALMEKALASFLEPGKAFKYNFTGLIKHKLGIESNREDAYFCSEFVDTILKAGSVYFDKHSSMVTPYDFAKNAKFKFVTRGLLKSYSSSKVSGLLNYMK